MSARHNLLKQQDTSFLSHYRQLLVTICLGTNSDVCQMSDTKLYANIYKHYRLSFIYSVHKVDAEKLAAGQLHTSVVVFYPNCIVCLASQIAFNNW